MYGLHRDHPAAWVLKLNLLFDFIGIRIFYRFKWLKSLFSKSESKKDSITVDESSKIEILSRKRAKRGPIEGIEILRAYINETVNVTRQISKILNTTESSCPILR